jgi:capsular exopolysaccharide synthesis family protein
VIHESAASEAAPVDLRDLFSLLWRRRWLIGAVVLVVLAASLALSYLQTPVYESKASVLVEAPPANGVVPVSPNMATERRVAGSPAVAKVMADKLKLSENPVDLLRNLAVDVPVETEIIDFIYSDQDPREAQRRVEAFADAYLEFRREKLVQDASASRESLQAQARTLNSQLQSIDKKLAAATNATEQSLLQSQATAVSSQIMILGTRLAELSVSENVSPGRIVEDAAVPVEPSRPNHRLNGALGIVFGLMLAVGLVLVREYFGDRIKGTKDLEVQIGAPVLSAIPTVRVRGPMTERMVTMQRPNSVAAEAFRQLRANFVIAAAGRDAKTILVTSAREREGKTFAAANLGVVLAKAGMTVILLSADLRRPQLEQLFGLSAPIAYNDTLDSDDGSGPLPANGMWSVDVNLTLVSLGTATDSSTELLGSSGMSALIKRLRELADFVLIDAAPLLTVADAATVAPACDAVLIVADANSAARKSVTEAREQLERMQLPVLGAVLINSPARGF